MQVPVFFKIDMNLRWKKPAVARLSLIKR